MRKREQEYDKLLTASRNLNLMLSYPHFTDFEKLHAIETYLVVLQNTKTIWYARPSSLANEAYIVKFMDLQGITPATQDRHHEVLETLVFQ